MLLSPRQQAAATRTGQDVCAVAGPGSGKTRTLIGRYAWLVENGAAPERILAITFTEKAALEIKRRLLDHFARHASLRAGIERAPVSTIHGFCSRLLREHAVEAEIDPRFRVWDEREATLAAHLCLADSLDRFTRERRPAMRLLLDGLGGSHLAACLLRVYESLRLGRWNGRLELPAPEASGPLLDAIESAAYTAASLAASGSEAVRRRGQDLLTFAARRAEHDDPLLWLVRFHVNLNGIRHPEFAAAVRSLRDSLLPQARRALLGERYQPARELVRDLLLDFHAGFQARKHASGALDFSDLEEKALHLLESRPALRQEAGSRFDAILMDELQDTNPLQWRLVDLIRRPDRFFAVGDANQSIYGFRFAEPKLFDDYRAALERQGKVIDELEDNYRTRAGILAFVEKIVPLSLGLRPHRLRACAEFPPKPEPSVELMRAEMKETEPEWIAHRILQLAGHLRLRDGRVCGFGDIGILARNTSIFDSLEAALQSRSIPYRVVSSGRNFFDAQEIVDLTNWLRMLEDCLDEVAAFALLRSPFYALGDEELYRLHREGRRAPEAIEREWASLRAARAETPPDLLLARRIDESGYAAALSPQARANVAKFLALLREWSAAQPAALADWIDSIEQLRAGREPTAPLLDAEDAVQLLSIHKSKGLEFPVVFVAGIHKRTYSGRDPLEWMPAAGLGFAWLDPASGETLPDAVLERIRPERQMNEASEADRLLYVAATRAEEHLVLSWELPQNQRPPWPERIEQALQLDWDTVPPNEPQIRDGVLVTRCSGRPPALPRAQAALSAPAGLEPVAPPPSPASSYSVTDVVLWNECPRRFLLDRTIGWSEPSAGESATEGSEIHELLARGEGPQEFWDSPLGRRIRAARRDEAEYDFVFAHRDVVFRGAIDRWFDDCIVDFKTGAPHASHALQLQLYALGVPEPPKEAFLVYLRSRTTVPVALDRALALERLDAFLDAQCAGEWPFHEGPHCRYCPHQGTRCPASATL